MASNNLIQLNFLQLLRQDFSITLFRRSARDGETRSDAPGCKHASLPVEPGSDARDKYWCRFHAFDGSEEFQCGPDANRYVALDYLLYLLSTSCRSSLKPDQFEEHLDAFDRCIALRIREHPQGTECLQIHPYYLRKYSKYGFIVDYSFAISPPVHDWREVQRLSLSLDRHLEANRNFYSDRYDKVYRALERFSSAIFPLRDGHQDIPVDRAVQFSSHERCALVIRV